MNLHELVADLEVVSVAGSLQREIAAVALHAEDVEPGDLFVAVAPNLDGGDLDVETAMRRGAAAVVMAGESTIAEPGDTTVVRVADDREALGRVLAAAHDRPSQSQQVLAVTGTNGKTTTAWLLAEVLSAADRKDVAPGGSTSTARAPSAIGLIGTVEIRVGDERRVANYTTPPVRDLQPLLAEMRDAGCSHVVMEATSHALALGRLAGTRVGVGGFTNLTRDHLDFHGTMERYAAAKARLFTDLAETACFAVDDACGTELARRYRRPKFTVSSTGAPADVRARSVVLGFGRTLVTLEGLFGERTFVLPFMGGYNVQNALVALGMAVLSGLSADRAIDSLEHARSAPGRCEVVAGDRQVLVDYAHTPDALERVLSTLRQVVSGRILCVFGAGGDRDRGKRPEMGRVAARLADIAIVTSDNPRTESPESIVAEIVAGMNLGAAGVVVELDRRNAIARAIRGAARDDVVLIAGKGHEVGQIVGDCRLPFDDRLVAAEILAGG